MRKYLITIDETKFASEPEAFFMSLKGVNTIEQTLENDLIFDPNIYDANGDFQWISLTKEGLPVPNAYLNWRMEQVEKSIAEGNGVSLDEVMSSFENKVQNLLRS